MRFEVFSLLAMNLTLWDPIRICHFIEQQKFDNVDIRCFTVVCFAPSKHTIPFPPGNQFLNSCKILTNF